MSPNGGIARFPLTTTSSIYPLALRVSLPAIDGYAPAPVAPLPSGMWQPWQIFTYSSSPPFSANLKPALSVDPDEAFEPFCASDVGEISDRKAIIGATNDNKPAGGIQPSLTGLARLSYITSHFDDTSVQPRDGVER
jgi:hypothetical protein